MVLSPSHRVIVSGVCDPVLANKIPLRELFGIDSRGPPWGAALCEC